MKQLDSSVIKFIPKALGDDGNITIVGILIKGLIGGLILNDIVSSIQYCIIVSLFVNETKPKLLTIGVIFIIVESLHPLISDIIT